MNRFIKFALISLVLVGCSFGTDERVQEVAQIDSKIESMDTDKETNSIVRQLSEKFAENGLLVENRMMPIIGGGDTEVMGFSDSLVEVSMFDNNHPVLGNNTELEDSISIYSSDEFYGEIVLEEKAFDSEVLLQYTSFPVMASHGSMKNEYFYNLNDDYIVKVVVTFPHESEVSSLEDLDVIEDKVDNINNILLNAF